jgi:hypothetical protein
MFEAAVICLVITALAAYVNHRLFDLPITIGVMIVSRHAILLGAHALLGRLPGAAAQRHALALATESPGRRFLIPSYPRCAQAAKRFDGRELTLGGFA